MNQFLTYIKKVPLWKHAVYWTAFVLFWGFVWGLSDYDFLRNILIQINCLPSRMLLVYVSLYVLIPKYFMKKKYLEFAFFYILLVLFISVVIQRPLMLFYVQPTYMPNWNKSDFFASSEIINTALDINIAAIIPLGYKFLQALETLRENNNKLEEENINFKDNKDVLSIDLKIDKSVHKILINDILYIESQRNNVRIKMDNTELIVRQNISSIQDLLPENRFLRVHRSFIINKEKISSYSPSKIEVGKETIVIGRKYKEEVMGLLGY